MISSRLNDNPTDPQPPIVVFWEGGKHILFLQGLKPMPGMPNEFLVSLHSRSPCPSVTRALGSRAGNGPSWEGRCLTEALGALQGNPPACCWNSASRTWHEWLRGLLLLALPQDAAPVISWEQFNPWPVAQCCGCLLSHTSLHWSWAQAALSKTDDVENLLLLSKLVSSTFLLSKYCSFSVYNVSYLLIPTFFWNIFIWERK